MLAVESPLVRIARDEGRELYRRAMLVSNVIHKPEVGERPSALSPDTGSQPTEQTSAEPANHSSETDTQPDTLTPGRGWNQ